MSTTETPIGDSATSENNATPKKRNAKILESCNEPLNFERYGVKGSTILVEQERGNNAKYPGIDPSMPQLDRLKLLFGDKHKEGDKTVTVDDKGVETTENHAADTDKSEAYLLSELDDLVNKTLNVESLRIYGLCHDGDDVKKLLNASRGAVHPGKAPELAEEDADDEEAQAAFEEADAAYQTALKEWKEKQDASLKAITDLWVDKWSNPKTRTVNLSPEAKLERIDKKIVALKKEGQAFKVKLTAEEMSKEEFLAAVKPLKEQVIALEKQAEEIKAQRDSEIEDAFDL